MNQVIRFKFGTQKDGTFLRTDHKLTVIWARLGSRDRNSSISFDLFDLFDIFYICVDRLLIIIIIIIIIITANNSSRTEAVGWGHQGGSGSPTRLQSLWTAHVCMWKASRCTWTVWTVLPQECSQTTASQLYEWHHLESHQASSSASSERTSQLNAGGQKSPDGTTLLPWAKGKPLAWDVTVPDTYAESLIAVTVSTPGAAAHQAAQHKIAKYTKLASTHPIAIETAGTWDDMAIELVQEIDRRTTVITQDTRETVFLFQRLSIALQRGNAVSFLNTKNTE